MTSDTATEHAGLAVAPPLGPWSPRRWTAPRLLNGRCRTFAPLILLFGLLSSVTSLRAQSPDLSLTGIVSYVGTCPADPTLKAAEGGGDFTLDTKKQTRIPYGVHFRFVRKISDADAVFLELLVEGEEPVRLNSKPLAGRSTCYEALLPVLPQDRAITLVETIVRSPPQQKRDGALGAVDRLRDNFLKQLFEGRWATAAAEQHLTDAIAEDFGVLTDTTAFSNLALVTVADHSLVPLRDTVQRLFLARAPALIAIPDLIAEGQSLLRVLELAVRGEKECSRVPGSSQLQDSGRALDRLLQQLAPLRNVATAEALAALYDNKVLPLRVDTPEDVGIWIREACADSRRLETLATRQVARVRALTQDPLTPFHQAIAAAKEALRNSYEIAAVDAFGGFTTTLQRFGQLDVVNAYVFDREEVHLVATFGFYPLRRRYGAEREPHSFGDHLVLTVGYSVATPVRGAESSEAEGGLFTAGAGLRVNQTLSLGAGKAFIDGNSHWYVNLSFDLGSIPGLENAFARK
jgi:hypothetical protein